jgi:uncharacterized damage-inducible protein DinB
MDIVKLVEYNIWANRLIGKQIESLPEELFVKQVGGSFGSIKATINHLLESDWLWLKRFEGIPIAEIPSWQVDSAMEIYREWKVIQDDTLKIIRMLVGEEDKKIRFITRKGIWYDMPVEDLIIHITNHGTYHRGQLTHMLRVVGQQPVGTDYFIFCAQK